MWVPPHQRGVVLLAQQALLFPHLTAAANVAFGPRSQGRSRKAAKAEALRWLAAVDATEFADRRPAQLSGGQAQRIAIARALAAEPALLLLDEPMAALDVAVAPALRQLLRKVLRDTGRTALLVTHDLIDALSLADRVIVARRRPDRRGRTHPHGAHPTPVGVRRPHRRGQPDRRHRRRRTACSPPDGTRIQGILDPTCATGEPAVAVFSPAAVAVHLTAPTGSPRNHLAGHHHRTRTPRRTRSGCTPPTSPAGPAISSPTSPPPRRPTSNSSPANSVHFAIKATEVQIYPAR